MSDQLTPAEVWRSQFRHIYIPERGVDEYECRSCGNLGTTPAALRHGRNCPAGALATAIKALDADRRRLEDARPFVEAAAEEAFTGPEWAAKAKAWLAAPEGEEKP
jgi:hypothetical protein